MRAIDIPPTISNDKDALADILVPLHVTDGKPRGVEHTSTLLPIYSSSTRRQVGTLDMLDRKTRPSRSKFCGAPVPADRVSTEDIDIL